jgi:glutamate 5-kinase
VPLVKKIDASIRRLGADSSSGVGTGGMITKIEATKIATASGVRVVIAAGREPDIILKLAAGDTRGTHFLPTISHLESRQRWMVSGLSIKGKLTIDSGAALALKKENRSLLAAGVKSVEGKFARGDMVAIYDAENTQIGCGISNYSSADIGKIKGFSSAKIGGLLNIDYGAEVVHRNNLALMEREESSAHR